MPAFTLGNALEVAIDAPRAPAPTATPVDFAIADGVAVA